MKRFENAKVGDKVYCRLNGFGTIRVIDKDWDYPVEVAFNVGECGYTLCGRLDIPDVEPILFYVDGDNKYSETRPKQKVEKTGWVNIYRDIDKRGRTETGMVIYSSKEDATRGIGWEDKYVNTIQINWFEEEN